MLGIMIYKLGGLDVSFESELNPIEDSDVDKAIMYYLITRENSIRGLGKSLTLLFLAHVDAAGLGSVLNLGVDTPPDFYKQFGFCAEEGTFTRKRMVRPVLVSTPQAPQTPRCSKRPARGAVLELPPPLKSASHNFGFQLLPTCVHKAPPPPTPRSLPSKQSQHSPGAAPVLYSDVVVRLLRRGTRALRVRAGARFLLRRKRALENCRSLHARRSYLEESYGRRGQLAAPPPAKKRRT